MPPRRPQHLGDISLTEVMRILYICLARQRKLWSDVPLWLCVSNAPGML